MNKTEDFMFALTAYLKKNTSLSDGEISTAAYFLSALTVTPAPQRYGVLKIMVKAIEEMEKIMSGEGEIIDFEN